MSINAFNDFPFNTLAVNAGTFTIVSASASAVATTVATLNVIYDIDASVSAVASASGTVFVFINLIESYSAEASATATARYLYNDGLPILITDWPVSLSITTTSWDDAMPSAGNIVTLER